MNQRCLVCDTTDKWENVDKYRKSDKGMHICGNCGFVTYPERFKSVQEAKDYYHEDYRNPPSIGNFQTGQRKIQMHRTFLTPLIERWKKEEKKPLVCDIGAAYGMFLAWMKQNVPGSEVTGTEFTQSYRRNAYHEYNVPLTVDFDDTKKYDLIASYKVAEHQVDADKFLKQYKECLTKDGLIYVSVPVWFGEMKNSGNDDWDIEYYYHTDHINVWTRKLFEVVLKKVGLEVIQEDHVMYGSTYLCKRNDELMKEVPVYEDPEKIKELMDNTKKANDFYERRQFTEAVNAFPNFPKAWTLRYEQDRSVAHKQQGAPPWEFVKTNYIEPALKACPSELQVLKMAADICMRYDKYKDATDFINAALEIRPNNAALEFLMAHCLRGIAGKTEHKEDRLKLLETARDYTRKIREVDPALRDEATNWIYQDNAHLPTPLEV